MGIFLDHAPRLWAAGLNVMPLNGKKPLTMGWQNLSSRPVNDDEKAAWLAEFPDANIGMVLGECSGYVALDIDTDDARVLGVVDQIFPWSPWTRRGKKGFVRLYRFKDQRTFRVNYEDGTSIADFLSTGSQIVLPPSIHPDIGRPYTQNVDLLEQGVRDQIPFLPPQIEDLFKDALRQAGVEVRIAGKGIKLSDFVPVGARDTALVSQAGRFSYDVLAGKMSLLEAIEKGHSWVEDQTARIYGDDVAPLKMVEKIIECLKKDIYGPRKCKLPPLWDDGLDAERKKQLGVDEFDETHRRFSGQEIMTHFQDRLESGQIIHNSPDMMALVGVICQRLAGNVDGIDSLEMDRIIRYVSQAAGGMVSVSAIRKQIAELSRGELRGVDHAELAKAVLDHIGREGIIRCHNEQLWQWYGAFWRPYDESQILKVIANDYGHYPAAKKAGDHFGILKTLKTLVKEPLQKNTVKGINFCNGYLTEDLELKPHDMDYGANYVLPYPYRPELAGKATRFTQMLADYWGDDEDFAEKVEALQQAFAATLFGVAPSYFRAFCLYGVAGSGKSRILEIVRGLMPSNCVSHIAPTKWNEKFDVAEMADKLLNQAGELSETANIDGPMFKQIVEGTIVSAQRKNQPLFTFKPIAAHWFGSNHPPSTKDSSDGFTRRWLVLRFNKAFNGKKIADYEQIVLSEEREAIAAWAVQGLAVLKLQGIYTLPKSHWHAIEVVANKANSVRFFLQSLQQGGKILLGEISHRGKLITSTSIAHLHFEYRSWCMTVASVSPVSSQIFQSRLEELQEKFGYKVRHVDNGSGVLSVELQYLTHVASKAA